jgi:predicted phosphodiesterase
LDERTRPPTTDVAAEPRRFPAPATAWAGEKGRPPVCGATLTEELLSVGGGTMRHMRPDLERFALISDVHGNLTALEAVLEDIDARGIRRIFNLGDYVGKGPRGREVIDVCRERCEVNILGNWDDFLPDPDREFDSEALAWWLGQLSEGQGEWLRGLSFSHDFLISGRQVRLFHASPTSVHRRVRFDHDEAEFLEMFTNTPATGDGPVPTVVGYGDTHDAYYEVDRERRTLFNTGSVGNSMDDPTPVYVILEGVSDSTAQAPFSVQFVRVPYDVESELSVARAMGLPEIDCYASEIRDGVYRGDFRNGTPPQYHRPSRRP